MIIDHVLNHFIASGETPYKGTLGDLVYILLAENWHLICDTDWNRRCDTYCCSEEAILTRFSQVPPSVH